MDDLDAQLAALWTAHLPQIDARLATIDAAVAQLDDGALGERSRSAAVAAAHQLAGSAGTFGFAQASAHATAFGKRFAAPHDAPELAELAVALRASLRRAGP
jgi:HPt (histidine-containing phosphotransfer) domain-containing protein